MMNTPTRTHTITELASKICKPIAVYNSKRISINATKRSAGERKETFGK
jgi:hypothetical protein